MEKKIKKIKKDKNCNNSNKTKLKKLPVLNIRNIVFYGCSEITRTRNFTIFTVFATSFGQITAAFHFF